MVATWKAPSSTIRIAVAGADRHSGPHAGYAETLSWHPGVTAVVSLTHDEALEMRSWSRVDVLVIDPIDPSRPDDQIPGVGVVERIRSLSSASPPRVVAISPVRPDDAVRRRLREAGADAYFHRLQVEEPDRLHRAVFAPLADDAVPEPVDHTTLASLGITERSRVNRGVAAAFAECLVPAAGWVGARGRDLLDRRRRFNEIACLRPMGTFGGGADAPSDVPSLAQIQRFVSWATHIGPAT